MPDVLKMLDPDHMIYPLKEEEAVLNFLKTFEMFAGDYRSPKYKEWNTIKRVQEVQNEPAPEGEPDHDSDE